MEVEACEAREEAHQDRRSERCDLLVAAVFHKPDQVRQSKEKGNMMSLKLDRRNFIKAGIGVGISPALSSAAASTSGEASGKPWPLCLNTSTIRPTPLKDKIRVADEAGYDGIELWTEELEEFAENGGDLAALGAQIRDRGLFVPNVIGLWNCMPDGQEAWEKSLIATRRRMEMAARAGAQHIAAIPSPDRPNFDLKWAADRYRDLLQMGRERGITIAFEFVGFLKGIHRLGQAAAVALDSNDPDACLVADTFHLHRGGSGFNGIRHLNGDFIAVFHWNDVPAGSVTEKLGDRDRIYPGDGILPLRDLLRDLKQINYKGPLSLELFNREHWKQDPLVVAKTGLSKMKELIAEAGV